MMSKLPTLESVDLVTSQSFAAVVATEVLRELYAGAAGVGVVLL